MAHKHTPAAAPVNRPIGYDFRPMRPLLFGEFPARGIAPRIGLITDNRGNAMNANLVKLLPLLLALLLLSACGGGDSGGGSPPPPASSGGGGDVRPPPPPPPPPSPSGIPINAALQQGTYCEFAVNTETTTFAQPSTLTTTTDFGMFRVTLGASTVIGGATVHPLIVTGTSTVGGKNFAPRWTHVGTQNGSVVGSTDGATLQTVYNGATTSGSATGFFFAFGASETVTATSTTFTGEYNTLSAVRSGHSTSNGGCETILGITICSDSSTTFSENEFYKDGVGPIGYARDISYSSSGGGFFTSTTIHNKLEIVGTSLVPADLAAINPSPWVEVASMATARQMHTASVFGGEIYVFGGVDASHAGLSSVEIYNPGSNSWRAGVSAPVGLNSYKAKTVGTKTFLIAANSDPKNSLTVRVFDHNTNTWTTGATTPFTDSFDVDVWVDAVNNRTFVLAISSDNSQLNVWGYEVSQVPNQWFVGRSLATTDHRRFAISVIGDQFYLAGGYRAFLTDKIFNGTYRYGLPTDVWTTVGLDTVNVPRQQGRAVNLNGAMVVLGGTTAGSDVLRDVESYSVAANVWTNLPKMLRGRYDHAAVVLNGKIYAIGGTMGGGTPIAKMEVYAP
jgi:hypothetical protein